jgi:hypothetical protein
VGITNNEKDVTGKRRGDSAKIFEMLFEYILGK